MRKQDYMTLAAELRRRIALWSPAEVGMMHYQSTEPDRRSESLQAASLARYLAEHLHVDRAAFLTACGLRP